MRPRDNVIVRLCSIECCFRHPIGTCDHAITRIDVEEGAARRFEPCEHGFADDLGDWSRVAKRLFIWDYTTNYRHYLLPFPNLSVLKPNLRLFKQYGVSGVFEQGNYAPGKASAFAPLKIYLLGKLLWDVDADVPALIRRFVTGYYGAPSADTVLECVALLESAARSAHMGIFDEPTAPYLNDELLQSAGELLDRAAKDAEDATHRDRVARERLSISYASLVRLSMNAPARSQRIDAFACEATRLGIVELFERRELKASFDCMRHSRYAEDRSQAAYQVYRL